jgi:hypothetical protein
MSSVIVYKDEMLSVKTANGQLYRTRVNEENFISDFLEIEKLEEICKNEAQIEYVTYKTVLEETERYLLITIDCIYQKSARLKKRTERTLLTLEKETETIEISESECECEPEKELELELQQEKRELELQQEKKKIRKSRKRKMENEKKTDLVVNDKENDTEVLVYRVREDSIVKTRRFGYDRYENLTVEEIRGKTPCKRFQVLPQYEEEKVQYEEEKETVNVESQVEIESVAVGVQTDSGERERIEELESIIKVLEKNLQVEKMKNRILVKKIDSFQKRQRLSKISDDDNENEIII